MTGTEVHSDNQVSAMSFNLDTAFNQEFPTGVHNLGGFRFIPGYSYRHLLFHIASSEHRIAPIS